MKIVFIGCVESSRIFLNKLIYMKVNLVGVITKEKSDFNSDFEDLSEICRSNNINYKYVKNINEEACIEYLKNLEADIAFCFGWSQLLKREVIDLFPNGIIGFHPTKLPFNKGRHPGIWALVLGLNETASTFFQIDTSADTGKIILQELVNIEYKDTARTLYDKIVLVASKQLEQLMKQVNKGKIMPFKQSSEIGNVWRKRGISDGQIDWRMSSFAIYNLVRGLSKPYIGAHFLVNGNHIKVWRVEEIITDEYKNIEPGKVLEVLEDRSFVVKTYDNLIRVIECEHIIVQKNQYL